MMDDMPKKALKDAESAVIPAFSPPTYETDMEKFPDAAEEVFSFTDTGLLKAICPKCRRKNPMSELTLWPDPERQYEPRFLCSGCRSEINRRDDTLYKDDMLIVLKQYGVEVPDKLIQWMRVQCKIASHPGGATKMITIDVQESLKRGVLVSKEIEGGRTGVRSGVGVVD